MRRWAVLIAVAAGLAGCGESKQAEVERPTAAELRAEEHQRAKEARSTPEPQSAPEQEPEPSAGGFTGVLTNYYEEAHEVCGAFSASKVATDLGLPPSSDLGTIAIAYSHLFIGQRRQPAFEGCLDGLGE